MVLDPTKYVKVAIRLDVVDFLYLAGFTGKKRRQLRNKLLFVSKAHRSEILAGTASRLMRVYLPSGVVLGRFFTEELVFVEEK